MKFHAWSNGHMVEFDIDANRYSLVDPSVSADLDRERPEISTMLVRQVLRPPASPIPRRRHLLDFYGATRSAARIRRAPIVEQLNEVDEHMCRVGGADDELSSASLMELAATYQYLRSLRIRQPLCLEDSMAGYLFFRRYTAGVQLVIGVRYPPFKAHAWLEAGGILINDRKITVETMSEVYRWPR